MIRKALAILILVSMVLHCASRLGVLSTFYKNRHTIAVSIGLMSEKPITTCQSDYFQSKNLSISQHNTDESPLVVVAQEINLFFQYISLLPGQAPESKSLVADTLYTSAYQYNFFLSIFHPPQAA